jgi:hypothetical protein
MSQYPQPWVWTLRLKRRVTGDAPYKNTFILVCTYYKVTETYGSVAYGYVTVGFFF